MEKKKRFASFRSLLYAILTSRKHWRCIRWCDNGTAVLITSPQLFEREVLRRELTTLNLQDFASFVKMLKTIGFQRVLSARLSKTQKFRHPGFQINGKDVTNDKKGKEKEETRGTEKRNMTEKERDETRPRERQVTSPERILFKNFETPKKNERRGEVATEDFRGSTAVKRKRDATELTEKEHQGHAKRQKQNTCTTVSSADQNPPQKRMSKSHCPEERDKKQNTSCTTVSSADQNPPQKRMSRSHCPEEITAAQAMLGLSTLVVLKRNIPVMLAYNLVDSNKAFVLLVERSAREIEAAQALMDLSHYCLY